MLGKVCQRFLFGTSKAVPLVDISNFLQKRGNYLEDCKNAAEAFHKYGSLIIKNPDVKNEYNEDFLDMMETYFLKRSKQYYVNQKADDVFPEYGYQTGATPEFKELAKNSEDVIKHYTKENRALTPQPPPADAKWRYFWRIGQRPEGDRTFDPPKHSPKDFPDFAFKMVYFKKPINKLNFSLRRRKKVNYYFKNRIDGAILCLILLPLPQEWLLLA